MKKPCTVLIIFIMMFGVIIQTGCSDRKYISSRSSSQKITIGFSIDNLQQERWYIDKDTFVKEAEKLDADVIVNVAYNNADTQISQVKDMVAKGIDVLVIIPYDCRKAAVAVNYAKKNGVKVIAYDRLVLNADVDLYASFDNEKVGTLQANAMIKAVSKGNYVIINGPSTDYNTVMINKGIMDVLNKYIKAGQIKIVKQIVTKDWSADEASDSIAKLLKDDTHIDAIIAENDTLAAGAIDALAEYHLISSVPVVGMDADIAACQRVVEEQQLMTVYKPISKLATAAADVAVKLAKNEKVTFSEKINDGKYDVPYLKIEPLAVDKENMYSTVIKDGFHTVEEVYMNVPKSQWPEDKNK